METATKLDNRVNGIDVEGLRNVIDEITEDPTKGVVEFRVNSTWQGQTCSETTIEGYKIGGKKIKRPFKVRVDEPLELLGENTAPNPQEMLMTALNACMMVGYVAGAASRGIVLESLSLETHGELDLRGFLGIDPSIRPGYESVSYTVRIKGNGTREDFREIHENVLRTSPNYFNVTQPIRVDADLIVEP